ncbi:hypothetical protein V565_031520 [Rhizoctonia solani 123E]|uniref:Uncharacterized protein n=1 Tax=Rhizoctonia solani 123E TaxID=1423351 RepID=A0A074S728_9AGAM|nr:hypothetical protein V565_031520 [Rhizoctonia solani 123E]
MSESLGKPWIESSVVEILVDHAHELPSSPKLQGRAQIVKFLTFRDETPDDGQPKDRTTVLWAEITDGEWIMQVRIANEATNKFEDEYKRALTSYRRGFFTLKAAVSFDFVPTQNKPLKLSSLKQLLLNIVELSYISGGGSGIPVATRAAVLRKPPIFDKWEQTLSTGGQTLTNRQAQEKIVKNALRSSKANSRRSNATNASKKPSKAQIKTSAQAVTPQPSINAAKRDWQEAWFGKRHKLHGVDYIPPREGFEPTADQQAKFEAILERIKAATPAHQYDPTNMDNSSSVPDRSGVSTTSRSSQVIRPSQVVSSTPVDVRLSWSKPLGSQLRTPAAADKPASASSEAESNGDDSDSDYVPVRSQQASKPAVNQTNRVEHFRSHIPTPRPSNPRADEGHEELSSGVDDNPRLLEADDAIIERALSQALASVDQRRGPPTVLVPDSDPPNPSQHPTQMRYSSPWDCEDGSPSEHDISYSQEVTRASSTKDKRRLGSTLSSPSRSILDASHSESMSSQPLDQVTSSAKQQGSSGQGESQPSAAASLPSPPPEDLSSHKVNMHQLEPVSSFPPTETICLAQNLPHSLTVTPRRDPKEGLEEQQGESFETKVDRITSRKRRLSQSPGDDAPRTQLSRELALSHGGKPITDNKRRRLDDSHIPTPARKDAPRQLSIAREGPANEPREPPNATKPTTINNRTEIIPHDHEAWVNPSWMKNAPVPKQAKPSSAKAPRISDVRPLDKPQARRAPRPSGLRILQPPFHHPTQVVERAPSPEFPPVTASQFADADEDFGVASSKVEPPTPARPINKLVSSRPRVSNTVQSRPTPRGQPAVSIPGPSKQARASNKPVGNSARVAQGHERVIQNGGRNSEERRQPEGSNRSLTVHHPTSDNIPEDSIVDTAQPPPNATARQPYLGGFQPSIAIDLPRKYQWTWENWLEVTKDAYSFWLE